MFNVIADRYAEVKMQIEALEKELNKMKKEIKDSGYDLIEGEQYKVVINLRKQTELSEEKIMAQFKMTLDAYKKATEECKIEKDPVAFINYEKI